MRMIFYLVLKKDPLIFNRSQAYIGVLIDDLITKYIKEVKLGLKIFRQKLKRKNIQFVGGLNSCFIFLNLKNQKVYKMTINQLKKENIYVRGGWPEPYNNYILVSGSTLENFNKFVIKFFKIFNNN